MFVPSQNIPPFVGTSGEELGRVNHLVFGKGRHAFGKMKQSKNVLASNDYINYKKKTLVFKFLLIMGNSVSTR